MMAIPTVICGLILVTIGSYGYLNATPNAEGKVSPTALIPAIIGALIMLCGVLALRDGLRKHAMHAAAMLGLLGFLGGFAPLIRQIANKKDLKDLDPTAPSAVAGLAMSLVCAAFVAMCVRSFIAAGKAREAKAAA